MQHEHAHTHTHTHTHTPQIRSISDPAEAEGVIRDLEMLTSTNNDDANIIVTDAVLLLSLFVEVVGDRDITLTRNASQVSSHWVVNIIYILLNVYCSFRSGYHNSISGVLLTFLYRAFLTQPTMYWRVPWRIAVR